jgi:hypothetical protein
MHIKIKRDEPNERFEDLISALSQELGITTEPLRPDAPLIIEEEGKFGFRHVTVVWSLWEGVREEERGYVIMEAYGRTYDPAELLKITLAVGLTPDEADKLGLEWRRYYS